ncbi:MAG: DUF2309 family protein [Gammaproteobacteria bacterium]|nr:DUF2309 family protein [Gammaproteobacteria bacterium]
MSASTPFYRLIEEAAEPVSQFWPMKGFVSHNPIQGLEHLPFDEAFRQAKDLFGAEGYLPAEEYRALLQTGRITQESVNSAMARVGPENDESVSLSSRTISAKEVLRLHLLHGIDVLEPALLEWQLTSGGALEKPFAAATTELDLAGLWQQVLSILKLADGSTNKKGPISAQADEARLDLPFRRTLSDWLDELTNSSLVASIDQHLIKWTSSFVDEGMASWSMPGRPSGFYLAWRELAQHDASARLLGIKNFSSKVAALPEDPEAGIQQSLQALQIPEARWPDYLTRVLAQLPGWTGLIRWRGLNPDDPIQKAAPIDVVQYLAVRMFYERELVQLQASREWRIEGNLPTLTKYLQEHGRAPEATVSANKAAVCSDAWRLFNLMQLLKSEASSFTDIRYEQAKVMLGWLDEFPVEQHLPVWLEAYEDSYRNELLSKIHAHRGNVTEAKERPLAQAAFCIDVRSEPFRRHFEATGAIETIGYAGFFGIPMSHRGYDTEESFPLCPVLLSPSNALYELPREGQQQALSKYASGTRWLQLGEQLFHDIKHSPIASFLLVDVLGLFFSVALIGKTLFRRSYHILLSAMKKWFVQSVETEIQAGEETGDKPRVSGVPVELTRGYSVAQQADFVEGGLRVTGLTENLGRFVVLCGHGSTTDNNPYSAALDCGACGGRHGDPNARTFAIMANNPLVRAEIKRRGLDIPEDTWFLPAKHNTTADTIEFYDVVDVPQSHREDLEKLRQLFIEGGEQQALDRCKRIPGTPSNMTAKQAFAHVESRSFDWATSRPEWGLSGNAAFIIGRRMMTKGLDLGGRCFLHSYNALSDPEGALLEKIMTAPLVVGEWINMQYYTSATDPWKYGSGSKVIHNVVGGVGVMYGAQSDLATGLPLQTVNDGASHFHEPVRLLTLIEADHAIVGEIIARHDILQQFFHNGWLNLVVIDPNTFEFRRYNTDASWELLEL